jgi:tRNA (guanine10-N2)-methyltransferase
MRQVYFGIELCRNKIGTAKFNCKFELSKRIYLGPTSTDNDLAFLMCNQALVSSGSCVIDPFVGTGGLLIPPASKGAITFGSDLDIRVINGYSVGRINKKSPYYKAEMKY